MKGNRVIDRALFFYTFHQVTFFIVEFWRSAWNMNTTSLSCFDRISVPFLNCCGDIGNINFSKYEFDITIGFRGLCGPQKLAYSRMTYWSPNSRNTKLCVPYSLCVERSWAGPGMSLTRERIRTMSARFNYSVSVHSYQFMIRISNWARLFTM